MPSKKRRGVDSVADCLMEQCSRERQEALALQKQVHQESMAFHREMLRTMQVFREADAEEARLDRELVSNALERNFHVLETSMVGFESLVQALLQHQHRPVVSALPSDTPAASCQATDSSAAKPPPPAHPS